MTEGETLSHSTEQEEVTDKTYIYKRNLDIFS